MKATSRLLLARRFLFRTLFVTAFAVSFAVHAAETSPVKKDKPTVAEKVPAKLPYFARVGSDTISIEDYAKTLQDAMKEKYFHGKIPEKELQEFRRQVGDKMINDVLYLQEAKRRGIVPDKDDVAKRIQQLERKKKNDTYWQEHKDQMLKAARQELESKSILKQLEKAVRTSAVPSDPQIQEFYKSNADKFTAPERVKVHMILIKVDPSSTSQEWENAAKLASDLVAKLRKGENFEELARIHSGDDSAAAGGDMGYIHKGMLGSEAAAVLEKMKIGDLSEPVYLLEGIAVFRLDDRENARLNEFQRVDDTAKDLLQKDLADKAWKNLTETLRKKTQIEINQALFSAS